MLIPPIKHFSAFEELGGAELEDGVEAPLEFLYAQPYCVATLGTAQSVGTGGDPKLINLNAEAFDNDTMHDSVTNPSRITFTTGGIYLVGGQVTFHNTATAGHREVHLRANSAGAWANGARIVRASAQPISAGGTSAFCMRIAGFTAGTHMEMWAYQNSGSAIDALAGGDLTFMFAMMIRV